MIEFTQQRKSVVTEASYTTETNGCTYTFDTRAIDGTLDNVTATIIKNGNYIGNMTLHGDTRGMNIPKAENPMTHLAVMEEFLSKLEPVAGE